MKKLPLVLILFTLFTLSHISAQEEKSNWRLGIGIGINSLRLGKEQSRLFRDRENQLNQEGNRFSFQGNVSAIYKINKHWRFITGLGLTHATRTAFRKTEINNFLGPTEVLLDDVIQKYLLIELPLNFRWQIIAEKESELEGIKPFIDFGLIIKTPLTNKSSYNREHTTQTRPLFGTGTTTVLSYSGDLNIIPVSLFMAIGFTVNEHTTVAFSFTGVRGKTDEEEINYMSSLKSLTVTRFF